MVKLLQYESKQAGIWVYAPALQPLEVSIDGWGALRRHDLYIELNRSTTVLPSITDIRYGRIAEPDSGIGYRIKADERGRINVLFTIEPICECDQSDLSIGRSAGKLVRQKAEELALGSKDKYELTRKIYDFVMGIPSSGSSEPTLPRSPTQVLRRNQAIKCVCKSQLMQVLCRLSGIPAREQGANYYTDEQIAKYSHIRRRPAQNFSHSFNSFFMDSEWHHADASLGGFDSDFRTGNYYDRIIVAKGFASLSVKAKTLE